MAINQADQLLQALQLSKTQVKQSIIPSTITETKKIQCEVSEHFESEKNSFEEQQRINTRKKTIRKKSDQKNQSKTLSPVVNSSLKDISKLGILEEIQSIVENTKCNQKGKDQIVKNQKKFKSFLRFKRPQILIRNPLNTQQQNHQIDEQEKQPKSVIQDPKQLKVTQQSSEEKRIEIQAQSDFPFMMKNQQDKTGILEIQAMEFKMFDILKQYKLHTVDQIEEKHKQKVIENRQIKRKSIFTQNICNNEAEKFSENMAIIGKFKDAQHEKIHYHQKKFLVHYCIKFTARKIYQIVQNIMIKNSTNILNDQIQTNIRGKCKNIAQQLFKDCEKQTSIHQKIGSTHNLNSGKKKIPCHGNNQNFITIFKRKLQQTVRFIKFSCLENWQLLTKVGTFSLQFCILIKNFEQYLQKQCGLNMKNQEKFEDIVKQIGIDNQKTAFTCLHHAIQMEVENDSINSPLHLNKELIGKQQEVQNNIIEVQNQTIESK